jgi:uncharacterized protein
MPTRNPNAQRRAWLRAMVLGAGSLAARPSVWAAPRQDFFDAIEQDDWPRVATLLADSLDVNVRDSRGNGALFLAIRSGSHNVTSQLLKRPDIAIDPRNQAGETPLMMAALRDHLDVAKALHARGAALHQSGWAPVHYAATGPGAAVLKWLLAQGVPIDARAASNHTPLMMAARYGSDAAIEWLLKQGADSRAVNDQGETAAALALVAKRDAWATALKR